MKATSTELRVHSQELLAVVSRGEEITITYRGKPCAKLIPYIPPDTSGVADEETNAFGIWADRDDMDSVEDYLHNLRKGRFA